MQLYRAHYIETNNEENSTAAAHAIGTEICLVVAAEPVNVAGCTPVMLPALLVASPAVPETLFVLTGLPVDFALVALPAEPPAATWPVEAGLVFP